MKQFFKITLATMLGLVLTGLLFFFLLFAVAGAIASGDGNYTLKDNSYLTLELSGNLSEQAQDNPFNLDIPGLPMGSSVKEIGLNDVLAAIKKAKETPEIKGIFIKAKTFNAGYASLSEIRNALNDFKESGKYIVAYADQYDQKEYFLSSVADHVLLNPIGMINFSGLASTPIFFTEALKKLGVKVEIFKVGTYKSAVEPYMNTEMSPASREQTEAYLNGIWNTLLNDISQSRALSVQQLNEIADQNTLLMDTKELLRFNLVDSLVYASEVDSLLNRLHNVEKKDERTSVSISNLLSAPTEKVKYQKTRLAVLYADGEIVDEGSEGIVREDFIEAIQAIQADDKIKAVVLRVNSPGGSAYASEQIWKAIDDLKTKKPVVVSMGDLAASGGYYIASGAQKIVASSNTLTGSIGIFGMFLNVEELTQKIGLNVDVVKTNELSDFGDMSRQMTDLEKAKMQRYIESGYELFVKRCAEGRKMSVDAIKAIAEGRVWTGEKAKELGLVDELGDIDRAIELAAEMGQIEDYQIVSFPEKKDFVTELIAQMTEQSQLSALSWLPWNQQGQWQQLEKAFKQQGVLARMEYSYIP